MEFYGKPNGVIPPTDHSPPWVDAVNAEFYYDQHHKQDVVNPVLNLHENPLTMATTTATTVVKAIQSHLDYYQQPIPTDYINDNSRLYLDDNIMPYAPCQGPSPWNFENFAQCYGFYGQPPCPLVNIIDMEDFMWVASVYA